VASPGHDLVEGLVSRGFHVIEHARDDASFGNEIWVLDRHGLAIQLVLDRSRWTIDVRGPEGAWYGFLVWKALVDGTAIEATELPTTEAQSAYLLDHLEQLERARNAPGAEAALSETNQRFAKHWRAR
jgi:hypothetical protein